MNPNIIKPTAASRHWKRNRRDRPPIGTTHIGRTPIVREPFVAPVNDGKAKRPPAFKPAPFDVTAFQKHAHGTTAVTANEFHANRSKRGTFGQSKGQKAHRATLA